MTKYNPKEIEKKWQKFWLENKTFATMDNSEKPKYYILDMFPYPSGSGLHVGHPKGYIATDVVARMKMMQQYNVLHPMGWDAFGLPAENYAIKNGVHPKQSVDKNIAIFKKQLGLLGFTYDWDREVNTTDPKYYKWTQWIFLQMFKQGLAYESFEPINWCPSCLTGLANEDLEGGRCERCGSVVEKKPLRQWVLKITKYADRLLSDLDNLPQWPENIKEMQRDWIGRKEGVEIKFFVRGQIAIHDIAVFTTRPDTIFGVSYVAISAELAKSWQGMGWKPEAVVLDYIEKTLDKQADTRERSEEEKSGVCAGFMAVNPVNNQEVPVWITNYVMGGVGTGAIMGVPAHDERDFEFANKFNLPIKRVVVTETNSAEQFKVFTDDGTSVNSDFLNGLSTGEAKAKMISWLEENDLGKCKVNYKMRDWVFSRQRYWGEPIPLIYCENCAKQEMRKSEKNEISEGERLNPGWVPLPEDRLPLELPMVEKYEPSGTGESPLATITDWTKTVCPRCSGPAKRETNTMPQWAGSCWYYLRYEDAHNDNVLVAKNKEKYWSPIDLYVGGAEHATRHLIYARFWHKFLFDISVVQYEEPFTRLQSVGLILAEDGRKMSKRWGNVINPDDIVDEFGADSLRLYEMFMGPFSQAVAWDTKGVVGVRRFLEKVWLLQEKIKPAESSNFQYPISTFQSILHQTIKKVTEDIDTMRFNTAIAKLMELVNEMGRHDIISKDDYLILIKLLSPFAPHLAEELWSMFGSDTSADVKTHSMLRQSLPSIVYVPWPQFDAELAKDQTIIVVVQINGKVRDEITVDAEISEADMKALALASGKVQKWLVDKVPKKIIYVKGKLVSVVV